MTVAPALSRLGDFAAFVETRPADDARWTEILNAAGIGRPVGAKAWVEDLEKRLGRTLSPKTRGRKPRAVEGRAPEGDLFDK